MKRQVIEVSLLNPLISITRTEVKKRRKVVPLAPLAQNVMSRGQNSAKPPSRTPADREALRRAFQRDIDDTVTEILAEEAENALARELDFDGMCVLWELLWDKLSDGSGL